jgi:hypothetical protein
VELVISNGLREHVDIGRFHVSSSDLQVQGGKDTTFFKSGGSNTIVSGIEAESFGLRRAIRR